MGWVYGTNSTHCIRIQHGDRWSPTEDEVTPDGSIYDPARSLTLVIEVANSQALSAAREQIAKAMQMDTVVGGIILDFRESPPYSSPKEGDWKLSANDTFLLPHQLAELHHSRWGPRVIQGYQFGGTIEASLEVIQRDQATVCAKIIPSVTTSDKKMLDTALNSLWKGVVASHTNRRPKKLKSFSVENLCDRLDRARIKTTHDRYHKAFARRPKRKQPPESSNKGTQLGTGEGGVGSSKRARK